MNDLAKNSEAQFDFVELNETRRANNSGVQKASFLFALQASVVEVG